MKVSSRISIDPLVCHGKPCVAGHRIPVVMVLELLAQGLSFDEILRDYYPALTKQDIKACLLYARHLIEPEPIKRQKRKRVAA
ncbi:putative toxin-antitoxin system, antitoxin component [Candidatus Moduliflexus flocculans]|uniref:Putative toxin-antitoxin system, antitoxin component n=1 Tax=Candidatus Moduliflexus flocculans TaxID=1499966 RepID=A0A0S6VU25_9BACT|nr:putative toxin-antitoxin system, antitoxin component [Candidatus Moduliflexus flocculans]